MLLLISPTPSKGKEMRGAQCPVKIVVMIALAQKRAKPLPLRLAVIDPDQYKFLSEKDSFESVPGANPGIDEAISEPDQHHDDPCSDDVVPHVYSCAKNSGNDFPPDL